MSAKWHFLSTLQAGSLCRGVVTRPLVLHSQAIVDVGDDLFQHSSATPQRAFEVYVAHHAPPVDQQRGVAGEPTSIARKGCHERHRRRRHERLAQEPHVTAMSLTKEADFLG